MKTIFSISMMIIVLLPSSTFGMDCGHLNVNKCATLPSAPMPIFNNDKYQHFGKVAKGFDGNLSVVYRQGSSHGHQSEIKDGEILFIQSFDNGKTWGPKNSMGETAPLVLSNNGLGLESNVDYRDVNIGYTGHGILVVTYTRKDYTNLNHFGLPGTKWLYRMSIDNGKTWTTQADIDTPPTGLIYGQIAAIPLSDGSGENSNKIITTGYYSSNNIDYLANWVGTVTTTNTSSSILWERIEDTSLTNRTPGSSYTYSEHTILPLTNRVWIAASRGPTSINIFKTLDGGEAWSSPISIPMEPLPDNVAPYEAFVAPTLDVMQKEGQPYLVLLYTQRPCIVDYGEACSVFKIGSGVQSFIDNEHGTIQWSNDVKISTFPEKFSGYQSGVFLNNDITKYFHLEFNENSSTDADAEAQVLDLKEKSSNLTFPIQREGSMMIKEYFGGLTTKSGISGWDYVHLFDNWHAVPSNASINVVRDDDDGSSFPSHLKIELNDKSDSDNDYVGINNYIENFYSKMGDNQFLKLTFRARTDLNQSLNIYYSIGKAEGVLTEVFHNKNYTVTTNNTAMGTFKDCFRVDRVSDESGDARFTIGLRRNDTDNYHNLTLDNIVLTATNFCMPGDFN